MATAALSYDIGESGQTIFFTESVLKHLWKHRQTHWWKREAGGLLFARIDRQSILVAEATGPRRSDRRGRYFYRADRGVEQGEIAERHLNGLHYIGDWHSHPEKFPVPSGRDEATMATRVIESRHQLNGFLFVIAGQAPFPSGLAVVVHDGIGWHKLEHSYSTRYS